MKRLPVLSLFLLLAVFLSACGGSLPFEIEFTLPDASQPEAPAVQDPSASDASPTPSPTTAIATPSPTPTFTPVPTRRSPYPVGLQTPLPDPGFLRIGSGNASLLQPVFSHTVPVVYAVAGSQNKERVLIAASDGIHLFDSQGELLAHWPEIKVPDIPCDACLSANEDASIFAAVTRENGILQIQIYNVVENQAILLHTVSEIEGFGLLPNPAGVAISADGTSLAYRFGDDSLKLHNIFEKKDFFEYDGRIRSFNFSRGGQYLYVQRGQELLIWNLYDLESGFSNLWLPDESAAIDFAFNGANLTVANGSKIRIYSVLPLRPIREIEVRQAQGRRVTWQISSDRQGEILSGQALEWNTNTQTGRLLVGEWRIFDGETLLFEERQVDAASLSAGFWETQFSDQSLVSGLDVSTILAMRFTSQDILMLNTAHTVCNFRLASAETNCQQNPDEILHALDGPIFREIQLPGSTQLLGPLGDIAFELPPAPILWVSRSSDFVILNDEDRAVDLHLKDFSLPPQPVQGRFISAAENPNLLIFMTKEPTGLFYLTMFDKTIPKIIFQKRENNLYAPLGMSMDGTAYFLRETRDPGEIILQAIPPGTDEISDILRLELWAEPVSLAISPQNILAIGLQDGSLVIVSLDSLTYQLIQVLHTPISSLAFSPDSRYLAIVAEQGLTVLGVIP